MFKKRTPKSNDSSAVSRFTDKTAGQIVGAIIYIQNRFAVFMNKKTKHYSKLTWKILIVFFAVAWGGMSIYFISTAFTKQATTKINSGRIITVQPKKRDSQQLKEEIYKQQKNSSVVGGVMVSGIPLKACLRNNRAGARLSSTKAGPYKTSNSTAVF